MEQSFILASSLAMRKRLCALVSISVKVANACVPGSADDLEHPATTPASDLVPHAVKAMDQGEQPCLEMLDWVHGLFVEAATLPRVWDDVRFRQCVRDLPCCVGEVCVPLWTQPCVLCVCVWGGGGVQLLQASQNGVFGDVFAQMGALRATSAEAFRVAVLTHLAGLLEDRATCVMLPLVLSHSFYPRCALACWPAISRMLGSLTLLLLGGVVRFCCSPHPALSLSRARAILLLLLL